MTAAANVTTCDGCGFPMYAHTPEQLARCGNVVAVDPAVVDAARGYVTDTLEMYDAALDVIVYAMDAGIDPASELADALQRLLEALERVGVLDRGDQLDPAAVFVLSPRVRPDPGAVIGSRPDEIEP